MQSIQNGGFQPPCPKATNMPVCLFASLCKKHREQRFLYPPSNFRYCGSRDEPPMTACGGNLIGGEISRNEQSRHEGELRRLRLRTLNTLVGCGAKPHRNLLLDFKTTLKNNAAKSVKPEKLENHSLPFTMVRAMRFFFSSTLTTHTFTMSPTLTTSEGCLMKRSAMREMCTRPS